MVKRPVLNFLNAKYAGTFIIKKKVDVGNNNFLNSGAKVKLYIRANSNSVKVYAYDYKEPIEEAVGKNILYLFDEDFVDEDFDRQVFEKKLSDLVVRTK